MQCNINHWNANKHTNNYLAWIRSSSTTLLSVQPPYSTYLNSFNTVNLKVISSLFLYFFYIFYFLYFSLELQLTLHIPRSQTLSTVNLKVTFSLYFYFYFLLKKLKRGRNNEKIASKTV